MEIYFYLLILLIAFLYSTVGHGGASGYLALMAIFSFEPAMMKSSALIMNLFVSGIAFVLFQRKGFFNFKKLLPFIITSIPAAFIGARISVSPTVYKLFLGLALLIAIFRILITTGNEENIKKDIPKVPALLWGLLIGFFSGMLGIGGGIILTPVLLLSHWSTLKQAAAISAAFIFLNSLSGLFGSLLSSPHFSPNVIILALFAISGGLLGSYSGSYRLSISVLKYILCAVLLFASIKLIMV